MADTAILYPGIGILEEDSVTDDVVIFPGIGLIGTVSTVAVVNALTATINTSTIGRLFFQFSVSAEGLIGFIINGKAHPAQSFIELFSSVSDFTDPSSLLKASSADLTSIQSGESGWFVLDCAGIKQISIEVQSATNSAVVTAEHSGSSSMPLILDS